MKAGELLADLLGKAGVDVTSETLKDIVSIGIDVHDDVVEKAQKNLFNMEVAKGGGAIGKDLKTHYVGMFATGIHQNLEEDLKAMGREDILEKIKDVKGTGDRIKNAFVELGKTQVHAKDNDEAVKALKAQNDKLQSDFQQKEKQYVQEKTEIVNQYENRMVNDAVMGKFKSMQWSDSIPEVVRGDVAKRLLDSVLAEKKAIIKKDENGNIQLLDSVTNSSVIDEKNNIVTLDSLIGNLMATNKLLKVTETQSSGGGTNQPVQRVVIPNNGTPRTNKVESAIDKAFHDQIQNS